MVTSNDDIWYASLREVRRQAKYIADATGLGSQVEGQARLFKDLDPDWEVINKTFDKVPEDGVWQEQQWLNAFECLFWETPAKLQGGSQQDDMMYYVLRNQSQAGDPLLLVRRKAKCLPKDLCAKGQVERISWVDTVLLNLVLQIAFQLSVTISRRAGFPGDEAAGDDAQSKADTVIGEVFASPYRLQVQGSLRKAGKETMVLAYPDICFTVDGSHAGFDQLVLRDAGSRLHVQLTAHHGIGLHARCDSHVIKQHVPDNEESGLGHLEPVELLSGFVSYEQMADAMENSSKRFPMLQRQADALLSLRGPGGQGRALVTAKWVDCSDNGHLLTSNPISARLSELPLAGSLLGRLKRTAQAITQGMAFKPEPGPEPSASGDKKVFKTAVHCSMLEVCLPVTLSASIILGVPLKASAED